MTTVTRLASALVCVMGKLATIGFSRTFLLVSKHHNITRALHFNFPLSLASLLDFLLHLYLTNFSKTNFYVQQLHSLQPGTVMQHRKAVQTENYPRASKAPKRIDIRYSISDSHSITKKPLGDVITSDHTRRELMRNCAQPTKRENECHNTIDNIDSAVSANG